MCSCYCINSGGRGTSLLIGRVTGRGSVKLYNFDSIWTLFLCGQKKTGVEVNLVNHTQHLQMDLMLGQDWRNYDYNYDIVNWVDMV